MSALRNTIIPSITRHTPPTNKVVTRLITGPLRLAPIRRITNTQVKAPRHIRVLQIIVRTGPMVRRHPPLQHRSAPTFNRRQVRGQAVNNTLNTRSTRLKLLTRRLRTNSNHQCRHLRRHLTNLIVRHPYLVRHSRITLRAVTKVVRQQEQQRRTTISRVRARIANQVARVTGRQDRHQQHLRILSNLLRSFRHINTTLHSMPKLAIQPRRRQAGVPNLIRHNLTHLAQRHRSRS